MTARAFWCYWLLGSSSYLIPHGLFHFLQEMSPFDLLDYGTRLDRSIAPTVLICPPRIHKGKNKSIWSIMRISHGSDSSSSGGSSYNLNELTIYLGSDHIPIPDDEEDAFDLLVW